MVSKPIPSPIDWEDGTVYTSTDFNTQIRDALTFLLQRPMFVGRYTGTSITVPTATYTAIPWNVEQLNTDGASMHSTVSNTSRVLIPQDGWWEFIGATSFNASANGDTTRRITVFRRNGSEFLRPRMDMEPGTTATVGWGKTPLKCSAYCTVGDYVELCVYHESGTGISTGGNSAFYPYMSARWDSWL